MNPTKSDEPKPYIQDDDKSNDNPDPNEKEKKKDDPKPHIKDDDKNKDNPDSHKKEKKKDEPVTPENRNSSKKYLWIILGIFGLAALVVMFIYRTRIMIKVFGWEKYVKKFHSTGVNGRKNSFTKKFWLQKIYRKSP